MKTYELIFNYKNGETDDYYYRRTAGEYWKSDAESLEEVIAEMREYEREIGSELWDYLDSDEAGNELLEYSVAEIDPETGSLLREKRHWYD